MALLGGFQCCTSLATPAALGMGSGGYYIYFHVFLIYSFIFRADDTFVYPWGERTQFGRNHYDSIIQIGLGPLRAFDLWRKSQGIVDVDHLTLDEIKQSTLYIQDSITSLKYFVTPISTMGEGLCFTKAQGGLLVPHSLFGMVMTITLVDFNCYFVTFW
jgi:hypothetical protein